MDDILQSEESQQFFSLVHMLQRSAMLHLGLIPDEEGMIHFNLGEAKAAKDDRKGSAARIAAASAE